MRSSEPRSWMRPRGSPQPPGVSDGDRTFFSSVSAPQWRWRSSSCRAALGLGARRRADPVQPATSGAAIGAACGLAAAALVDLWCPVAHLPHLLLGHLLPVALLALAGAIAGSRLLAIRFQLDGIGERSA